MIHRRWRDWKGIAAVGSAVSLAAFSGSAGAVQFKMFDGAVDGSFDTTVTYGVSMRTEPHEADLGGLPTQYGNRTLFDEKWDIFSNVIKASHDLEFRGDSWGAFFRGNYFYDFEMDNQPLPDAAENRAVSHGDVTDAYFYKRLADDNLTVRLGKQVISWGENTFIGGAINDINTVDITKLRQPGVELKDAFVGTPAVYLTWNATDELSFEGFYLLGYDEIKVDPVGSFYSTLDPIADGGGFANATDGLGRPVCLLPDGGSCDFRFGPTPVTRVGDDIPGWGGQFGVAIRYYVAELLNGFDFGLYYQRLHDHNPSLSAIAGTSPADPGFFFVDYPEHVERYGASFNTIFGSWAVGGELSYRRNAPIQDARFATAALGLEGLPVGSEFEGFGRYKRYQVQFTTQRLWGPMPIFFGADQWNTIDEVAYGWVEDVPGRDGGVPDEDGFVRFDDITNDFWGFQARSSLTYNNALLNRINMSVDTAWRWDVEGVSPEVGGAKLFIAGRQAFTLGVNFEYRLRWQWGVSHSWVWGGEDRRRPNGSRMNNATDRDFLSFNVSYTF